MFKIQTTHGHERMSTQDLLLAIEAAVRQGETEFDIDASGQHDIGGPLWHPEGKALHFHVRNAGQRVGSMCLPNTEIIVEESASADVGWLNAGGYIVVKGDAGDTAGHCSSGGKIYIGGRAGTRTGSLMKKDPLYEAPELWVLKNVGSFSFEFMGGGKAIVCGDDCEGFDSVLGQRACVGMVGGTVYVRGPIGSYPQDVRLSKLNAEDIAFLEKGMPPFLKAIDHEDRYAELSHWDTWHKLEALSFEEKAKAAKPLPDLVAFRKQEWVKGGIFGDIALDDFEVKGLLEHGLYRQRVPSWDNGRYAAPCEAWCPTDIPTQIRHDLFRLGKNEDAIRLVLDYTPFPGSVCGSVCPRPCMEGCTRGKIDEPIQIGALGYASAFTKVDPPKELTGKKIAVIGGGVAGLSAAWQLRRRGHTVDVYDEAERIGGKLEQVIPRARLAKELLEAELKRIEDIGVVFHTKTRVNAEMFQKLREENDAVVVASGGHASRFFNWEGKELLTRGVDYLKAINRGEHPKTGKHVVVIGCGNSGMDTCRGAYEMGAETVVAIDVQKPAAFRHEIRHIEALGGKLVWPFVTEKLDEKGVYATDGRFIPADQVIVSIGEAPILDYLPEDESIEKFRGSWLVPKSDRSILPGVFAVGDVIKPGRLTDAIGDARRTAQMIDDYVMGRAIREVPQRKEIPPERIARAWFQKCHPNDLPEPIEEHCRCISCGTCRDCRMCLESCPEKAISRHELENGAWEYVSDPERCIGCGICAGVCPCGVWSIENNTEKISMYRTGERV